LPKQLKEHGISDKILKISDHGLLSITTHYTREAGVRNLEREIANVCRKVAREIAEKGKDSFSVSAGNIQKYLGVPRFMPEEAMSSDSVGVSTGLAWTETGGDVLYVEAIRMNGKGGLTITGHLGDVMKESARAALSYVRAKSLELGIPDGLIGKTDLHIHVPAGAIPKDGPSAGITMATSIASALTGKPVRKDLAMTGEVTLSGRVLPIGGLKEKTLAAKRHGISRIIIPMRNKKDLEDIPKHIRGDMEFLPVETVDEVLSIALKDGKGAGKKPAPKKKAKKKAKKKR
jgi:ATP-dependent Lon protease